MGHSHETAVRSRGHERNTATMWQQLSQRRGHVAWDIVLLIMTLVVVAAAVFVIIVLIMIINVLRPF